MIRSKPHTQQLHPPAGQVVNPMANIYNEEEVKDKKLSDYIANVLKEEGLEPKKKLTFDEWLDEFYPPAERSNEDYTLITCLRQAWKAAQENV